MKVNLEPGTYVVAVSGGVDSVVLLDLLNKQVNETYVVAHFDHGIRSDSSDDAAFVAELARKYENKFFTKRVELGPHASEAAARQARYDFLHEVKQQVGANAIITAHHQDDVLETAVINLLRGTGRRGLTALRNTPDVFRPLLNMPKSSLLAYAAQHNLSWREDSTNHEDHYTRNYIRHHVLVRFDAGARQQLLAILARLAVINDEIDDIVDDLPQQLNRQWFVSLSHDVAKEVLMSWLRQQGVADFDRRAIERLTVLAKTKPVGKRLNVLHNYDIIINANSLALELAER